MAAHCAVRCTTALTRGSAAVRLVTHFGACAAPARGPIRYSRTGQGIRDARVRRELVKTEANFFRPQAGPLIGTLTVPRVSRQQRAEPRESEISRLVIGVARHGWALDCRRCVPVPRRSVLRQRIF